MGIIPRNKTEIMFIENIKKAHEFLNKKLDLNTKLDIERVCYWGRDAFHSGSYKFLLHTSCIISIVLYKYQHLRF